MDDLSVEELMTWALLQKLDDTLDDTAKTESRQVLAKHCDFWLLEPTCELVVVNTTQETLSDISVLIVPNEGTVPKADPDDSDSDEGPYDPWYILTKIKRIKPFSYKKVRINKPADRERFVVLHPEYNLDMRLFLCNHPGNYSENVKLKKFVPEPRTFTCCKRGCSPGFLLYGLVAERIIVIICGPSRPPGGYDWLGHVKPLVDEDLEATLAKYTEPPIGEDTTDDGTRLDQSWYK